ncbi:MAG: DUF4124 domain-containing protein [Deltaproteobacteria bacterium]|nr:DUF4124 domain-containing protein [Deltaproteobacteria bacterium]
MKRLIMMVLAICFVSTLSFPAFTLEVYKYTDATGKKSFSDAPTASTLAEPEVEILPDNPVRNPSLIPRDSETSTKSSLKSPAKTTDPSTTAAGTSAQKKAKAKTATEPIGWFPMNYGLGYYGLGYRSLESNTPQPKIVYPFKDQTYKTETLPTKTFPSSPIGSPGRK